MPTISEAIAIALEHHRAGRLPQAEAIYRQILQADPRHADAWHLLGAIAYQLGRHHVAVQHIGQAIRLNGGKAEFYSNLGLAYQALGQLAEAVACYRRALDIKPVYADAHNNLGNALKDQGQIAEAVACYQRAIQIEPDFAEPHYNLGSALQEQGQIAEAIACYRRALHIKPAHADAYNNLGSALKDQGQIAEAIACYQRALEIKPDLAQAHSNLVYTLHLCSGYDAAMIYEEHRRWNQQHAEPLAKFIQPHANDRDPHRRLRIGYVSPDFRGHPVGRFLLPLLEAHDHANFEIFCYASVRVPDVITDRCRACADVWRNVVDSSDEQVADTIRQDRIDILVDLTMHAADNRMLLFARKPAPVQVTYLAYCSTTGLDTMDYRLTDPYLDPLPEGSTAALGCANPPGTAEGGCATQESIYSERSIRLPETYWCYRPLPEALPVNTLPALQAGHVTFGCLNNFCKVTEPALAAWSRILQATPQSRLLLHAHAGSHRDRVRDLFARQGISPERLAFTSKLPWAEYCGLYGQMDIALDPFPYGGGTTTCDALWMGVPVVSLAGQTAVGRAGLSILSNVGLANLVARDVDEYVRIAAGLADDLPRLGQLRASLRDRMQNSPLMDAPRFARNVEAAYRTMWRNWCVAPSS